MKRIPPQTEQGKKTLLIKVTLVRWQPGKYDETMEDRRNKEMEMGMEERRDVGAPIQLQHGVEQKHPGPA